MRCLGHELLFVVIQIVEWKGLKRGIFIIMRLKPLGRELQHIALTQVGVRDIEERNQKKQTANH